MERVRILALTKNAHYLVKNSPVEVQDISFVSSKIFDLRESQQTDNRNETISEDYELEDLTSDFEDDETDDEDEYEIHLRKKKLKCQKYAKNYITGYLQNKMKADCMELDPIDSRIRQNNTDLNVWVKQKSYGKLTVPHPKLYLMCKRCDAYFRSFHGKTFKYVKDPINVLSNLIVKKENVNFIRIPPEFVKLFITVRMKSRFVSCSVFIYKNVQMKRPTTCR